MVKVAQQMYFSIFFFMMLRDDYDKEVKQAKELQRKRHTTTPRRPRRPDLQVYHPRCHRKCDSPFTQPKSENQFDRVH